MNLREGEAMSDEIVVVQSRHPVVGWKAVKEIHKDGFPSNDIERETILEKTGSSIEEVREKILESTDFEEDQICVGL
jgi:hypothetical protein